MANQNSLKSMLVSLGQLTLRVKDHLSDSHDQVTYANLLEELKQNVNDIEEMTATLSEESEEIDGEVYVIVSDARSWQIKLMSRINFLESLKMSANVNVHNVSNASNVPKMKPGRLQEVKLTVFKGDFEEWETFWSSFRANVDVRSDLEKTTKFIYLAQSLESEPKEMISGLARTEDNYSVALYILKSAMLTSLNKPMYLCRGFMSCLLLSIIVRIVFS